MECRDKLNERTEAFAVRIVRMFRALPHAPDAVVLGKQVLRSGTAIAANYRAARRARSKAEFIAKLGIVVEEADETAFWLGLMVKTDLVEKDKMAGLLQEATELLKVFSRSVKTARQKQHTAKRHPRRDPRRHQRRR